MSCVFKVFMLNTHPRVFSMWKFAFPEFPFTYFFLEITQISALNFTLVLFIATFRKVMSSSVLNLCGQRDRPR